MDVQLAQLVAREDCAGDHVPARLCCTPTRPGTLATPRSNLGMEASPSPVYGARLLSGLRVKPLAGSNPAASAV